MAQLLVVLQTHRHDDSPQQEAKYCPHASGVLTSATKYSGVGLPRRTSCRACVILCATIQTSACKFWRPELCVNTCFFLASKIPGRKPTKPRMNAQRSLLHACQGWTAGSRPSPYVLAGVACLRSTVIPWHMQQRLHKVWSHWLTSHEPSVTQLRGHHPSGIFPRVSCQRSDASCCASTRCWFYQNV